MIKGRIIELFREKKNGQSSFIKTDRTVPSKGLIIDLRNNGGGEARIGSAI
ncbi:MAG: hypothetical protein IPH68_15610 [Chitinophagaceae bacterium]|nr:hypothetical protein [Chitinophagaceae bacterium]